MKGMHHMKSIVVLIFVLINIFPSIGQRDLSPKKGSSRGKMFGGAADRRELRNYGFQFSAGPNYTLTRLHNETIRFQSNSGRPVDYTIDPSGRIGGFVEIGMAHFPMGEPKLKFIKKRFLSYYDWGLGFKYIGGKEATDINNYDPTGTLILSSQHGDGNDVATTTKGFYNGYVSGRFSLHKNIYFGEKYYLDNGLGVNFDYRVLTGTQKYVGTSTIGLSGAQPQHFHKPLVAQIHYDIGFGIKIRRGSYLIPGIQIPILGLAEFHKGNPSLQWYSSNYLPVFFHLKFIKLLEKKKTSGCNTGSEEDRKRNKEYMQGQ